VARIIQKVCTRHGLTDFYVAKSGKSRCKICYRQQIKRRQRERKAKATAYKGGKCIHCGYNKCQAALDFHHRDPLEKKFEVGSTLCTWAKLQIELDKCDLVCANCHREVEGGVTNKRSKKRRVTPVVKKVCQHHGLTDFRSCRPSDCILCTVIRNRKRRERNKLKAIDYKGGKCIHCGYDKYPAALEFHHQNPQVKSYTLARILAHNWGKIEKELDKCDLVCVNCHREVEYRKNLGVN